MFRLFSFIAFFAIFFSPHGSASVTEDQLKFLAASPQWRALLHYEPTVAGSERSAVVTEGFFLSDRGHSDPLAELDAIIAALGEPQSPEDPDSYVACRFPARTAFTVRELQLDMPEATCPGLDEWGESRNIRSASLIFASGHLSNPASFYGHLLLRLNEENLGDPGGFLDTTINYGAVIPTGENGLAYVVKGLFGGYVSRFSNLEFYNHNHNYADSQLRDVWEYRLNLSDEQLQLLINHSWEILNHGHRYYFLRQNCAFRVARILETVLDQPLLVKSKLWATPIDIFRRLSEIYVDGETKLVEKIRRFPSRQNKLQESWDRLSSDQQIALKGAVHLGDIAALSESGLAAAEQSAALDVYLNYLDYLSATSDKKEEALKMRRDQAVLMRLMLPPGRQSDSENQKEEKPPHSGHRSSLVQLGFVYSDSLGAGATIRLRPALKDLLSVTTLSERFSELAFGDTTLLIRDGALTLRRLDLVRITNLNINRTGLPGDGGAAWRFRLGAGARDLGCDRCTIGFVEYDWGRAIRLGSVGRVYALAGGRAAFGANDGSFVQAQALLGTVLELAPWSRVNLEGGFLQELDRGFDFSPQVMANVQLGNSDRWDVRLGIAYQESLGPDPSATEGQFQLSLYW